MKDQLTPQDLAMLKDYLWFILPKPKDLLAALVGCVGIFLSGGFTVWLGDLGIPLTLLGWFVSACFTALIADEELRKKILRRVHR